MSSNNKKKSNFEKNKKLYDVLIIIGIIIFLILIILYSQYVSYKEEYSDIEIDVYTPRVGRIPVGGIEEKGIMIFNNSDKKIKEVNIRITCYSNYNTPAYTSYSVKNLKPNETRYDYIRFSRLTYSGDLVECSTNYTTKDYNFLEWIVN